MRAELLGPICDFQENIDLVHASYVEEIKSRIGRRLQQVEASKTYFNMV